MEQTMQRAMSPQGGMQHNNRQQRNIAAGNQQQTPPGFNQENMHGMFIATCRGASLAASTGKEASRG